jgi:hypothetical protein
MTELFNFLPAILGASASTIVLSQEIKTRAEYFKFFIFCLIFGLFGTELIQFLPIKTLSQDFASFITASTLAPAMFRLITLINTINIIDFANAWLHQKTREKENNK